MGWSSALRSDECAGDTGRILSKFWRDVSRSFLEFPQIRSSQREIPGPDSTSKRDQNPAHQTRPDQPDQPNARTSLTPTTSVQRHESRKSAFIPHDPGEIMIAIVLAIGRSMDSTLHMMETTPHDCSCSWHSSRDHQAGSHHPGMRSEADRVVHPAYRAALFVRDGSNLLSRSRIARTEVQS